MQLMEKIEATNFSDYPELQEFPREYIDPETGMKHEIQAVCRMQGYKNDAIAKDILRYCTSAGNGFAYKGKITTKPVYTRHTMAYQYGKGELYIVARSTIETKDELNAYQLLKADGTVVIHSFSGNTNPIDGIMLLWRRKLNAKGEQILERDLFNLETGKFVSIWKESHLIPEHFRKLMLESPWNVNQRKRATA